MLKHEDSTQIQPQSTAKVRVTPEELTAALAAIETRRQEEAMRIAGTIPLDEAVSELHLDSTSDEIWAEVQAQRAVAFPQETSPQMREPLPKQASRLRGWPALVVPMAALGIVFSTLAAPLAGSHRFPAAPARSSLSLVPIGTEVYADDTALTQVSQGKLLTQIAVSRNATGNRWKLVKIGRHVYLRGCIANTDSLQSLQGKALSVYNDANSGGLFGGRVSYITLRVDDIPLQKSGGDSDYSEVTLPNFQPDSFTTLDQ